MVVCKHCDEEIINTYQGKTLPWFHDKSRDYYCSYQRQSMAEPKELEPSGDVPW